MRLQNEKFFASFHKQIFPKLVQSIVYLCPNQQEAEEHAQEAMMKLYTLVEEQFTEHCCQARLLALQPLAYRVARHLAINRKRHVATREKYHKSLATLSMSEPITMEGNLMQDAMNRNLIEAINRLPPICRKVFVLRKINGLSHKEIAQQLEVSVKTVENHLAKGMKLCREHLLKQQHSAQKTTKKVG